MRAALEEFRCSEAASPRAISFHRRTPPASHHAMARISASLRCPERR